MMYMFVLNGDEKMFIFNSSSFSLAVYYWSGQSIHSWQVWQSVIKCGVLLATPESSLPKNITKCGLMVQYLPGRAGTKKFLQLRLRIFYSRRTGKQIL